PGPNRGALQSIPVARRAPAEERRHLGRRTRPGDHHRPQFRRENSAPAGTRAGSVARSIRFVRTGTPRCATSATWPVRVTLARGELRSTRRATRHRALTHSTHVRTAALW